MTNDDEQDLLRKVNALLKKAESTEFPAEAEAFFAKAQELIFRHAIDEARLLAEREKREGRSLADILMEDYMFSSYAHYAEAKGDLLTYVATANSVRVLPYENRKDSNHDRPGNRGLHESQWTRLVGYRSDIESTKLLFLNLLVQSQRFATEDYADRFGSSKYSDDGVGKFTWIHSHMRGFSEQIGRRFRELREDIYASVVDANALILDKDANILEWMYEHGLARRPFVYCEELEVTDQWTPGSCYRAKGHTGDHDYGHSTCWALEPEEQMKAAKRRVQRYCQKNEGHIDPHLYDYRPVAGSSYVAKGRRESATARLAGRSAANRADIGLTRMGNNRSQIK